MTKEAISTFSIFSDHERGYIINLDADIEHSSNIITEYTSSPASDFSIRQETDMKAFELITFQRFIRSRIQYLNTLHLLGDNWISENSTQPNILTIEAGKILLRSIYNWFSSEESVGVFTPEIIMGPIPSGGLTFEIKAPLDTIIYFSLFNDDKSEIEIRENGFYFEFKSENDNYINDILNLLSLYGIRRDYSRWGNTF